MYVLSPRSEKAKHPPSSLSRPVPARVAAGASSTSALRLRRERSGDASRSGRSAVPRSSSLLYPLALMSCSSSLHRTRSQECDDRTTLILRCLIPPTTVLGPWRHAHSWSRHAYPWSSHAHSSTLVGMQQQIYHWTRQARQTGRPDGRSRPRTACCALGIQLEPTDIGTIYHAPVRVATAGPHSLHAPRK